MFKLNEEEKLSQKLLIVENKLEKVQAEKETLLDQANDLGRLRNLLFEKGQPN